jgi:hypothetical protein
MVRADSGLVVVVLPEVEVVVGALVVVVSFESELQAVAVKATARTMATRRRNLIGTSPVPVNRRSQPYTP